MLFIAAVVVALVFRDRIPFLAAPIPTKTQLLVQASPVAAPTATTVAVVLPVASNIPASTNTPVFTDTPAASATASLPSLPTLGGADLIAFLSNRDIWLVNTDGSNVRQLTKDGADKQNLQWSPDGQSLFYISGKCVQSVTVPEGVISQVACFPSVSYLDAFRISPDGTQVAISLNHIVYVVPFDLTKLKTARTHIDLENMNGIFTYGGAYEAPSKGVLWSSDGKKLAIVTLSPVGGIQVDLILVFDISGCTTAKPCPTKILPGTAQPLASPTPGAPLMPPLLDNFPGSRFTMKGQSTTIPSVDWDGQSNFLLNSIFRYQFGYLYNYNLDTKQAAVMIAPTGTTCCYSDAHWSPDGTYVLFAFQDINQGNQAKTQLFYVSYGSIGTGAKYTPLPLPADILTNPLDLPDSALRPAK